MRRALRFLLGAFVVLVAFVVVLAALVGWFVYTPAAPVPQLSGTRTKGSIDVGGLRRTYSVYVPRGLRRRAPLVFVMHGSGENGARIRGETGYAFDRLADQRGFAVVYPDAYDGYWDVCNVVGAIQNRRVDDVRFLVSLADKLVAEIGADPARIFAAGSSRGGSMALRLALEAPDTFRAVAAISASIPAPENFKCRPAAQRTSSVMIMNGTKDRIVPFDGGDVNFLGFFYRNGKVLSSRASAQYLADLNHIAGKPATHSTRVAGGIGIEQTLWRDGVEVELFAIDGGGHGLPQPYQRRPRLLGPSIREPNGAAVIWEFFQRKEHAP